jgi:hypothetical protein
MAFATIGAMLVLALGAGAALAALPRTYQIQTVRNPLVTGGTPTAAIEGRFGVALVNAGDVNADGKDDILVGTDEHGGAFAGTVFVVSGSDGSLIRTLPPPDAGGSGNGAGWGGYVGKIADLGSCPGFTGTPSQTCDAAHGNASNTVGPPDGVPDMLITALGVDVPFTSGGGGTLVDAGRAYVVDGATGAVLKRIDMPDADLADQSTKPGPPKPAFGRTILAPAGLPPCAGNGGIGTCPTLPTAVRIGDMNAGGAPDVIVDASDFFETDETANPESECAEASTGPGVQANCLQAGRSYLYYGESIAGSDTTVTENTPNIAIKNPTAQPDEVGATTNHNRENLGYSIEPIGDVGKCNMSVGGTSGPGLACVTSTGAPDSTVTPDGKPDVVISSHRTDDFGMWDAGVALLFDGQDGTLLATYRHPEPQPASLFGFSNYNQPAIGDVGSGTNPDSYQAAMRQNNPFTGGGRGYVMNGNFLQGGSPNGISFSTLSDPTPSASEDFGTSSAGIGNVAGAETSPDLDPRNEILIGAYGPHNPGTNAGAVNDVHIFSPLTEQELQRLDSPDSQAGSGFGNALAPVGDLNGDGFLDYAVGSGLFDDVAGDGTPLPNAGHISIFRSDNSPPSPPPPSPPAPTPGAAAVLAGRAVDLAAGRSRIRRGKRVRLRGDIEAFANPQACEQSVTVQLQRRRPGKLPFRTFARRTTNSSGGFSLRIRPKRTYLYRALVGQTGECLGDVSDRERVTVTRKATRSRARQSRG